MKLCNDWGGFQGSADSKLVDSRYPELIFISFHELGCIESALCALIRYQGPRNLGGVPLLDDEMGYFRASVVLWWFPRQSAFALRDVAENDGSNGLSGRVFPCRETSLMIAVIIYSLLV